MCAHGTCPAGVDALTQANEANSQTDRLQATRPHIICTHAPFTHITSVENHNLVATVVALLLI